MTAGRAAIAIAGALCLAACGAPATPPDNTVVNTAAPVAGDTLAKIAALPPGQLRIVLFRAIRDAGEDCQGLTGVQPGPADAGGRATWRATCRGDTTWSIAIGNDGIAQVTGPVAPGQ